MINAILSAIISWIQSVITHLGAWGVAALMAIESCNIPLPSEAILPFAGYLVTKGVFSIHKAAFFGAIGCVLGSIPSYYLGYFGGRKFIEKYGKYFLISSHDLKTADEWVEKYGDWSFFICRMLPVVRTFISLPAGILKAKKRFFFTFTFFGSLIWSYVLIYAGVKLGENIDSLKHIWHKFDAVIIIICLILGIIYIYHHIKNLKNS